MKLKFTNFMLVGLLCLSVSVFATDGKKKEKAKTKKGVAIENIYLLVRVFIDF